MIANYERETEDYIKKLEAEIVRLKAEAFNATTLMMAGERAREQLLLHSIVNGAFDRKPEENLEHVEGLTAEG
jgi:hypothetical protein